MTLRVEYMDGGQRDLWDQAVVTFAQAHPLNAYGWGKVRQIDGWQPSYLVAKDGDTITGMIMTLTKKIPYTGMSIMYAPKGPLWDPSRRDTLQALLAGVREEGRKRRAIFIRIDPNLPEDMFDAENDPFVKEGFVHLEQRWSFWNSPRDVYRIDLARASTEEELFSSIDRDARRCVRKAKRDGVSIRPAEDMNDLRRFYEIFNNFAIGKGFMCRKFGYQELLWHEYVAKGNGRLFLAMYQGEVIGGLVCIMFGRMCLAMHMGTSPRYTKMHSYYAYVWESIRWAKERGCTRYSFRGVGTTPSQESFKKKFRPQRVSLVGYYDLPFRPLLYRMFYFLEFQVLPQVWRMLMRLRRVYTRFVDKIKIMKLAAVQAD